MLSLLKEFHWKKSNLLEARLAVTGEIVFLLTLIDSKGKTFNADRKNVLISCQQLQHYLGDHGDLYICSSLFYFSFVIDNAKTTCLHCVTSTVTSTAAFYHCWNYAEHSHLLWNRCDIFCINIVCPYEIYEFIWFLIC